MELFGILFSVPAAFVAGASYSFLVAWAIRLQPWARRPLLIGSGFVLSGLVLEWCLFAAFGPIGTRELLGSAYYPAHLLLFFLSLPALANVLALGNRQRHRWFFWLLAGVLCAVLDIPVVLTQYSVSEALYGINGNNGPYSHGLN